MSSNVTKTEKQSIPRETAKVYADERRRNFNRSPSIEKIIKFNTYICSQNYYILPSLLAWLKTSQTVLQSYAERCIFFAKSLIYHTILYRILESQVKIVSTKFRDSPLSDPKKLIGLVGMLVAKVYDSITVMSEEIKLKILAVAVYFAFFLIFFQLFACVYVLSLVPVPGGLTFLLTATSYISYLNYNCLRLILLKTAWKDNDEENRSNKSINEKYIKPKNILGKRTISNLNLF